MNTAARRPADLAMPSIALLLATVLVAYWQTGAAMVAIWARSETFTHAFLVPPIALWLIWRQRHRLAGATIRPMPWVLLPIAGVSCLWLLGDLASVNALTQFALVATLVLAVPALLGIGVTRAILFPLCFLFFAVPVGEFLMPQLIVWTADVTVAALRLSGIPVYQEGEQFVIPTGNWSVVEACSGVRYLMASVMVGSLFAYLHFRSLRRRALFIAFAIAVPIVANWVRAYLIVLLGHLSDNRIAAGVDHLIYGWLFFGIVITIMFAAGARWSDPPDMPQGETRPAAMRGAAPTGGRLLAVLAAAATVILLPHLALARLDAITGQAAVTLDLPAALPGGWSARRERPADWTPAFESPSAVLQRSYAAAAGDVGVYLGYYAGQTYERKLVASTNALVRSTDPKWSRVASGTRPVAVGDGDTVTVRTAQLQTPPGGSILRRLCVWQLYWAGDAFTSSEAVAGLRIGLARLRGRGDASAVVIVSTEAASDAAGERILESFVRDNLRTIEARLRLAAGTRVDTASDIRP